MLSPVESTPRLRTRSFLACLLAISALVLTLRTGYTRGIATGFIAVAHPPVPVSAVQALGLDRAAVPTMQGLDLYSGPYGDGSVRSTAEALAKRDADRKEGEKSAAALRAAYEARNPDENNPEARGSIRDDQALVWGDSREGKAIPWGEFSKDSAKRGMVLTPFLPFLAGLGGKSPGNKPNVFDGIFDPNIAFDSRYEQTPEREYALKTRREFAARNPLEGYELNPEDQRNSQAIPFLKPNPEFEAGM
jgi:hypothetical protein